MYGRFANAPSRKTFRTGSFIFNPIVRAIVFCIFFTAFVVYPIFSVYQIVLKIKKRATQLVFKTLCVGL
jgi:hypothetical protein